MPSRLHWAECQHFFFSHSSRWLFEMLKMKYQKRKRKARAGEEKALEYETFLFSFYIFTIEEINICIEWGKWVTFLCCWLRIVLFYIKSAANKMKEKKTKSFSFSVLKKIALRNDILSRMWRLRPGANLASQQNLIIDSRLAHREKLIGKLFRF